MSGEKETNYKATAIIQKRWQSLYEGSNNVWFDQQCFPNAYSTMLGLQWAFQKSFVEWVTELEKYKWVWRRLDRFGSNNIYWVKLSQPGDWLVWGMREREELWESEDIYIRWLEGSTEHWQGVYASESTSGQWDWLGVGESRTFVMQKVGKKHRRGGYYRSK